jgi:hypothetical protein
MAPHEAKVRRALRPTHRSIRYVRSRRLGVLARVPGWCEYRVFREDEGLAAAAKESAREHAQNDPSRHRHRYALEKIPAGEPLFRLFFTIHRASHPCNQAVATAQLGSLGHGPTLYGRSGPDRNGAKAAPSAYFSQTTDGHSPRDAIIEAPQNHHGVAR